MSEGFLDSTLQLDSLELREVCDRAAGKALQREVADLFEQWRSALLRYLLALGLEVDQGEEIVQDVFLALFRHLMQGKPRTNLRGWLFRVAHNVGLKQRLRNRQRAEISSDGENLPLHHWPDATQNPEEEAVGKQRQQRLMAIVRALPEQDQYCLSLRAEGLRYREIAEVLDISLGSVSASLGRSLSKLARGDRA